MIVEFCGIPGGGKSTLAEAYVRATTSATLVSVTMYSRLTEAWYAGLFFMRHPVAGVASSLFAIRHAPRGLKHYSLHLALRACAKYAKAYYGKAEEILVDEGLLHIICTIPARPLSDEEIVRAVSFVPLPDVVCIAAVGDFHRFHSDDVMAIHPRARRGPESLQTWESAVRLNTRALQQHLTYKRLPLFSIEKIDVRQAVAGLDTFLKAPSTFK